MARLEKEAQKAILQYLELRRVFHWRNNTGAMVLGEGTASRRFMKFGTTGSPDIFILKDGVLVGLEVKSDTGKQSEAQIEFQKNMEKNGGKYYVVRAVDEVVELLK